MTSQEKLKIPDIGNRKLALVWSCAATVLLIAVMVFTSRVFESRRSRGEVFHHTSDRSDVFALAAKAMQDTEIARMNLLCAQALPALKDLKVNDSLARLAEMTERVRTETERHYYRFQRNPAEFENSEGFFRMLMLAVVLAEDFHVGYTPNKIANATDARIGDGFFADAHDVFLHGLTGAKPRGTCSSLPVLQVAIGRRLGYPLKLVTTKGHLFVRWEDARERFNIEAACKGVNAFRTITIATGQ